MQYLERTMWGVIGAAAIMGLWEMAGDRWTMAFLGFIIYVHIFNRSSHAAR